MTHESNLSCNSSKGYKTTSFQAKNKQSIDMSRLIILFYIFQVAYAGGNSFSEEVLPISSKYSEKLLVSEEILQKVAQFDIEEVVDEEIIGNPVSDDDLSTKSLIKTTRNPDEYDDAPRAIPPKPHKRGSRGQSITTNGTASKSEEDEMDVEDSSSEMPQSSSRKILRRKVMEKKPQ